MNIRFGKKFAKQYSKCPVKIKKALSLRLEIFKKNPFHPILNNHSLIGRYLQNRSINITGDWRAIYSEVIENKEKVAIFLALGTHSQLYK
ncbi:MAG: type II toxin-antitoxin system mRNA interferase toxin, RelE/StbE family [Patescibacteria group bacterium]